MAWPLRILAICALAIGLIVGPLTHGFANTIGGTPGLTHAESHGFHIGLMVMSAVVAVVGVGVAFILYGKGRGMVESLPAKFGPLYKLSLNKFYFDELFLGLIVLPLRGLAKLSFAIDQLVIDPLVDLVGAIPRWFSAIPRVMQNGLVSSYAYIMFAGVVVIVLFALQVVGG
jgi:NADH-quinone oxidoreductase subunit L